MASKTSMLKSAVKTTGKGLFAGMERLDTREEARSDNNEITDVISKEKMLTETVDASAKENETPEIEKIVTDAPNPPEQKKVDSIPIEIPAEPVREPVIEKVIEPVKEQIAETIIEPAQEPVKESVMEESIETEPVSAPTVPKENVQLQNINSNINITDKADSTSAKSSSRYEKEKFLLLDIRGYRDYVEHMAKAANMSATKYIRNLIQQDMDKNNDIYLAHKALEEKLRGRSGN